ncbi:hypothetical protein POM88_010493 [Heracleum sosnowskyi]|uniref:Uncharacterized protein n=1 Tax=Heracleum sosnowskyi TaxID=360622 RepID=A0AAD8IW39_9APIA|nr:hypothetical protein POM88_010493 [Heracleum sosnowskyi]
MESKDRQISFICPNFSSHYRPGELILPVVFYVEHGKYVWSGTVVDGGKKIEGLEGYERGIGYVHICTGTAGVSFFLAGAAAAAAAAENLRGLRHLQLIGNDITIVGLLAIIENCSHLESLDTWNCINVGNQLDSDLRTRLSQQIKDLRLPLYSTEDSGFGT